MSEGHPKNVIPHPPDFQTLSFIKIYQIILSFHKIEGQKNKLSVILLTFLKTKQYKIFKSQSSNLFFFLIKILLNYFSPSSHNRVETRSSSCHPIQTFIVEESFCSKNISINLLPLYRYVTV